MSDEISTGELGRRMDALGATVATGFGELRTAVEARPDWADVRRVEKGVLDKLEALTARVTRSEGWATWIGRLTLGGVVLALLGGVVTKASL
jgi:hypothetical protein